MRTSSRDSRISSTPRRRRNARRSNDVIRPCTCVTSHDTVTVTISLSLSLYILLGDRVFAPRPVFQIGAPQAHDAVLARRGDDASARVPIAAHHDARMS